MIDYVPNIWCLHSNAEKLHTLTRPKVFGPKFLRQQTAFCSVVGGYGCLSTPDLGVAGRWTRSGDAIQVAWFFSSKQASTAAMLGVRGCWKGLHGLGAGGGG